MKYIITTLLALIGFLSVCQAQPYSERIKNELNESMLKELEAVEDDVRKAKILIAEAHNIYVDVDKYRLIAQKATRRGKQRRASRKADRLESKGIKHHAKAAVILEKANDVIINVYGKKLGREFRHIKGRKEQKFVKTLRQEAYYDFGRAKAKRRRLAKMTNEEKRVEIDSIQYYDEQGMEKLLDGLAVRYNWPGAPKPPEPQIDTTENIVPADTATVAKVEKKPKLNISFRVQIIATKRQLTAQELADYYPEVDDFIEEYSGKYYKYSVGQFSTYEAARKFRDAMELEDAFVIAHHDGKRINVKEALELLGHEIPQEVEDHH